MPICKVCNRESAVISREMGVCGDCIKNSYDESQPYLHSAHLLSRKFFKLPVSVPSSENGIRCNVCANGCKIRDNERGYCGLKRNINGKLTSNDKGNYEWYYDMLPTNCVADWVCPGGTGVGFPEFSYRQVPEYGYKNLAVFMENCNFNCLFCQNWHFREKALNQPRREVGELSTLITHDTACVCFFGGDPTPQIEFIIKSIENILANKKNSILRICFETNGGMSRRYMEKIINYSLETGGCIKFDLKAWNNNLHQALCGVSNEATLENFKFATQFIKKRAKVPLIVASTLLIPGYVDVEEIRGISSFIASIDPTIPYTLLAFHPNFFMDDLPATSKKHAERCYEAAIDSGLKRVKIEY